MEKGQDIGDIIDEDSYITREKIMEGGINEWIRRERPRGGIYRGEILKEKVSHFRNLLREINSR